MYKQFAILTIYIFLIFDMTKKKLFQQIQEVFHVYLNKFEIGVTHLFLVFFFFVKVFLHKLV